MNIPPHSPHWTDKASMRDITPDVTEIVSPPIGKPTHLGCFHWHRPSATDVAEKNVDQLPVLSRLKTSSSRWGSFWLSLTCWRPSQNLIGSIKRLMGQIHDGFEKPFWLKKSAELSHYFHHVSCWVLQIPTFPFRPLFWLSCSSFSTVRTAASHSQPTERTFAKCFTSEPRRCAFTFANQLGSNLLGNPSGNLGNLLKFLNYSDFCENHDMVWRVPKPLDIFATFPNGYGSIPIDTFLVGWTSIYQLFWGSLGTRVLTHPQMATALQLFGIACACHSTQWALVMSTRRSASMQKPDPGVMS